MGLFGVTLADAAQGKIAAQRNHPQAEAIKVAGWLGMLTGIIWILAMIWAYMKPATSDTQQAMKGIASRESENTDLQKS
jgi:hypothetical protein